MRGSTLKKIGRFVDLLILNTPANEMTQSREELITKMKSEWMKNGPQGKKFVDKVLSGEFLIPK